MVIEELVSHEFLRTFPAGVHVLKYVGLKCFRIESEWHAEKARKVLMRVGGFRCEHQVELGRIGH